MTANYSLVFRAGHAHAHRLSHAANGRGQEPKIRTYIQAGNKAQPAFPKPLADSDQASLEVRRSGPVVAIVSGDAIPDESHASSKACTTKPTLSPIPQPDRV